MQTLVVILLFLGAAAYLVRLLYKQFTSRNACNTGCGKCSAVDFGAIEKKIKEKERSVAT